MKTLIADLFATYYGDDENQLIPMDQLGGGLMTAQAEAFDELITSTAFLPRIQLFGSTSEAVKEEKIGQGRFGLVRSKDSIEELGKSITCLPLSFRLKAMEIANNEVLTVYKHDAPEFKRIQLQSEEKDSGCMYGVEFLLWLPEQAEFVTYFLSSKSSRREAKPLRGLIGKGATVEAVYVKTKKYSWFAPKVSACSTPLAQLPNVDAMKKELERFNNPKPSETEKATDKEAAAVSGDRR